MRKEKREAGEGKENRKETAERGRVGKREGKRKVCASFPLEEEERSREAERVLDTHQNTTNRYPFIDGYSDVEAEGGRDGKRRKGEGKGKAEKGGGRGGWAEKERQKKENRRKNKKTEEKGKKEKRGEGRGGKERKGEGKGERGRERRRGEGRKKKGEERKECKRKREGR